MLLRLTSFKELSLLFILWRVSSTLVGLGGSSNTGFIFSPLITSRKKQHRPKVELRVNFWTASGSSSYSLLWPSFAPVPSYVWLLVTRVWTPRMAAKDEVMSKTMKPHLDDVTEKCWKSRTNRLSQEKSWENGAFFPVPAKFRLQTPFLFSFLRPLD